MFRACLAEQSAVTLHAELKDALKMAISSEAVQPRVLSMSGKVRGGALSRGACSCVIRRNSQPSIRIAIPAANMIHRTVQLSFRCADDAITCHYWMLEVAMNGSMPFPVADF